MQKVYTAQTLLMTSIVKAQLEAANIDVELRNEYAAGALGELSFTDTWPELWVSYEDAHLAKKIIGDYESLGADQEWLCLCGESNGSAFVSCWACQRDRLSP